MRKILFVINPHSGNGMARRYIYDMLAAFPGSEQSVFLSERTGQIIDVVKEKAPYFDTIIACGGDGTLNETVNGIVQSGASPELGYLATGTVNDFATSHKIPKYLSGSIKKSANGKPHKYDLGSFGDRAFTYVAAFGAFTDVAYETPQQAKAVFGQLAYLNEGVKRLPKLDSYNMSFESEELSGAGDYFYGMVSNTTSVGTLRIFEPGVRLDDGLLEVTMIKNPTNVTELSNALVGFTNPKFKTDMVVRYRTAAIRFNFTEPVAFTLDGEFGNAVRQVDVTCLPGAINLLE